MRRQKLLRSALRGPGFQYRYHDVWQTRLEAVFARGDRRLSGALELAYQKGRRFDAWTEDSDQKQWDEVFLQSGVDVEFYAHRVRDEHEVFPWDHLQSGVRKGFLLDQRHLAMKGNVTSDCRGAECTGCGVCPDLGVEVHLARVREDNL